ncbi:vWA domain-containing protein [Streptococcus sp. oral taxon 431]|uniref:vWA domain-containing protein n=1 Tax=Streptococcus sp. oral taxon 431 TaxID=712633 RepID=UPI00200139D9|nr:vWA domain-containing protein [Streptococcus sp. oral taxon 431]
MKKFTISRKQTLTLASVVLGTIFTGTTIVSADDVAPSTTQATPSTTQAAPAATTAAKSPITAATEEINAKANTPVVPADKAKTGDVIAVDVKKTGPSAKTDGADTTTTSTATIKTTSLADQDTPVGTSKPVSSTKTATSTKETADYTETTTETVNKTSLVEVTKEADVVNKKEVQGTSDIVFVIDKSFSMDSHINDTMKNVETFVRNLSAKNIQARLGLVEYEDSEHTKYHDFNGSKFTTDPESFISALKTIKTGGADENATVPLHHIATSADYNWGTGANNHRFAFLITDEDIDLTKDTPTKEATLKALQDAGISLTVVGTTFDKKDFDSLVNGTNGLYLNINKNFADLLNVQFANKVVETVQKGRVFKVQTDKYELISKTHRVAKAKPQTPSIQTPAKPTVFTPAKNEPAKTAVYIAPAALPQKEASLPNTGSKTSTALTTLGLGLLSMGAAFGLSRKTKKD